MEPTISRLQMGIGICFNEKRGIQGVSVYVKSTVISYELGYL